jgi:chromosome segregation ATPase
MDQLQQLQSEQVRNMKKLQSSVPSLQDYEEVKDANETLTDEITSLSKKVQTLEEQHLSAQLTVVELRNALSSVTSNGPEIETVSHLTQKLFDILNPVIAQPPPVESIPVDTDMIDTAPPAPVQDFPLDPMAT